MYAPVSRQIDASVHPACTGNGFSSGDPAGACLSPAQAGLVKASLVQTQVQTGSSHPAEPGAPLELAEGAGSMPLLLIAAVLVLIPALVMTFIGNARHPGLRAQARAR
ncbi:MAG: hypothetical protein Q8M37_07810 [Nevskia sp.]|nr:hypothetical protein [Nevskia sp.]